MRFRCIWEALAPHSKGCTVLGPLAVHPWRSALHWELFSHNTVGAQSST